MRTVWFRAKFDLNFVCHRRILLSLYFNSHLLSHHPVVGNGAASLELFVLPPLHAAPFAPYRPNLSVQGDSIIVESTTSWGIPRGIFHGLDFPYGRYHGTPRSVPLPLFSTTIGITRRKSTRFSSLELRISDYQTFSWNYEASSSWNSTK